MLSKEDILFGIERKVEAVVDLAYVAKCEGLPCNIPLRLNCEFLCDLSIEVDYYGTGFDVPSKAEVRERLVGRFGGLGVDITLSEYVWDLNFKMIVVVSCEESKASRLAASRKRNEMKRME